MERDRPLGGNLVFFNSFIKPSGENLDIFSEGDGFIVVQHGSNLSSAYTLEEVTFLGSGDIDAGLERLEKAAVKYRPSGGEPLLFLDELKAAREAGLL